MAVSPVGARTASLKGELRQNGADASTRMVFAVDEVLSQTWPRGSGARRRWSMITSWRATTHTEWLGLDAALPGCGNED